MVVTYNRDFINLEVHFGCAGSYKVVGRDLAGVFRLRRLAQKFPCEMFMCISTA